MSESQFLGHVPVLQKEFQEFLKPLEVLSKKPLRFLDATIGGGGHALLALNMFPTAKLDGVDRDQEALHEAKKKLSLQFPQTEFFHRTFLEHAQLVTQSANSKNQTGAYDAIWIDLGVSSHQLDSAHRGLSFQKNGPLDMRMDSSSTGPTAADLLNSLEEQELQDIFEEFGEERFSARIARRVIEYRQEQRFKTTEELENLVFHVYPKNLRHRKKHPATQVFQALRIAVNGELEQISQMIPLCLELLSVGGRLFIMSFHSLEDRIVKHAFRDAKAQNLVRVLTKRPISPSSEELFSNKRSRSVKMRILEKKEKNLGHKDSKNERASE